MISQLPPMRVLSLSRPWPWAIFDPVARKHIENRSWPPPIAMIGKRIALQSAKSWDDDAISYFLELGLGHFPNRKDSHPHSVIQGVVTIDRVVTVDRTLAPDQRRWFFGPYGWVLAWVTPLPEPVPCKGAQGLRALPDDVSRLVQEQLTFLGTEPG